MNHYSRISVYDADNLLSENPSALLLDVRDKKDYQECAHPKATFLTDREMLSLVRKVSKETPIVIYCYHGIKSRSYAEMLAEFGFKNCYSVDGGYAAWKHQSSYKHEIPQHLQYWLEKRGYPITDINGRLDVEGKTALMVASREGLSTIVRDLIDAGADPNLKDKKGNNALWYACIGQSHTSVKVLLNADIEVDNENTQGFTALNYAVGIDEIFEEISKYTGANDLSRLRNANRTNKTKASEKLSKATV